MTDSYYFVVGFSDQDMDKVAWEDQFEAIDDAEAWAQILENLYRGNYPDVAVFKLYKCRHVGTHFTGDLGEEISPD